MHAHQETERKSILGGQEKRKGAEHLICVGNRGGMLSSNLIPSGQPPSGQVSDPHPTDPTGGKQQCQDKNPGH